MLEVRRLRLLREVRRRGTIAAAAAALGYTPSAVSQQLAVLEREAGVTLLERDGRRVRLTPAAVSLVTRAERILEELEAAEAELAAGRLHAAGPVTAAAFPTAAETLVAPALAELRRRHPAVAPGLRQLLPEEGVARLRAGDVDVVVAKSYDLVPGPRTGGLERHALFAEELMAALPAGHPRAGGPVALRSLAGEDWVAGDPASVFGEVVHRACLAAGFEPRIVHRAEELAVQRALVRAGLGVALVPALGRAAAESGVAVVPLVRPRLRRHVHALVRRGASRRPEVAALLDALRRRSARLEVAGVTPA